ncbi:MULTISPECIES: glycosyltransferase [Klebsiella pneumoniae complex]|uniref:glycosyltransferase n=1 Tax=Klebsiella pneumoniae complex TaxID=3390273 RepID=UPI0012939054|nr:MULTISPECIES: glycosyltransferase [Klebsiella]EIY5131646.1 glycosyltransferase family 2 protein [Klebsiella variicola]MDV1351467.1 glycosyltransferase [Klebsiella quasipneumoniae subsp. similipneumoniae]MDV1366256.1 glycosyltransferase [Klebsiella quasipneumoniae subsp. similipneumoniae]MXH34426.1 glycosyltransferase [Klebsiella variicola]QFZ68633.1 glycosyltransferase [Klebsiella quasipneumoniae]
MKCFIAIPTYNGGRIWSSSMKNINKYKPHDVPVHIIDSGSKDKTVIEAEEAGFIITRINSNDFNHGGTRNLAVNKFTAGHDIVVFMTQDAIPHENFIENIISAFKDEKVACAYGRQVPHNDANPIAQHARFFNYRDVDYVCGKNDISSMGIKTAFMSNSFSAYRLSAFKEIGGFPSNTILCEDMYFTAKAILAGYRVAYVSSAVVEHSHNYSPLQEFKRYFDIGVFHHSEPWIREKFGGASGEGKKFITSELLFLFKNAPLWIPISFINNFMKLVGYKLGLKYKSLPKKLIFYFSMHKRFWK